MTCRILKRKNIKGLTLITRSSLTSVPETHSTHPLLGPFGMNMGPTMPTAPHRAVKKTTGKKAAPILLDK